MAEMLQLNQVARSQVFIAKKGFGQRHEVGPLAMMAIMVEHDLVEFTVPVTVEVLWLQDAHHIFDPTRIDDQRAENYLLNRDAIRHVAVNRAQRRRLSLRIVHCTHPNCAKRCCCARKDSKMVGSYFTGCWACFASC